MSKKNKLIIALEEERAVSDKNGYDTTDHDYAIHYLKTGEVKDTDEIYEILYACINDYELLCSDYLT